MRLRIYKPALLLAALAAFAAVQAEEGEVDNRPDYHGPYSYPQQSNKPYPAMPYGPAPCAYAPCGVAPYGNTYYEHNRDGTGYIGYGTPNSSVDAREHQWRTPYRLRREANRDDYERYERR